MLPEAVVLGGDDRLNEVGRDMIQRHALTSTDNHDPLAGGRVDFRRRSFDDPAQGIRYPRQVPHDDEKEDQHPGRPDPGREQDGVDHHPEAGKPRHHWAE